MGKEDMLRKSIPASIDTFLTMKIETKYNIPYHNNIIKRYHIFAYS